MDPCLSLGGTKASGGGGSQNQAAGVTGHGRWERNRDAQPSTIACRDLCSTQAAQARHLPSQPGRLQ